MLGGEKLSWGVQIQAIKGERGGDENMREKRVNMNMCVRGLTFLM